MEMYFESDYVMIGYERPLNYIKLQWLTPPANKEFKKGYKQMLMAIMHYEATKVLIDSRQQGAIHPDLIEWLDKSWANRAIAYGYRHCAIIQPNDIFALAEISNRTQIITEYFEEENIAIDWLKKLSAFEVEASKILNGSLSLADSQSKRALFSYRL